MKLPVFISLMALLLLAACGQEDNQPSQSTNTNAGAAAPASAAPLPGGYLGGLATGQSSAVKTVDVAALTKAIQMFNVEEGRFPRDLNELVEKKQIARIPEAPPGMKLDYNATSGEIKVVRK